MRSLSFGEGWGEVCCHSGIETQKKEHEDDYYEQGCNFINAIYPLS
jgi:hypothetical protein